MLFDDLNINKDDIPFITVILITSLIITAKMIDYNMNVPIYCSDIIVYMVNALNYANLNVNGLFSSYGMFFSPVICFTTSLLIRLSLPPNLSIYIVTGLFSITGNIGLYILLKNRFSPLLSLTGSVFYSSLSLTMYWWANGTLDTSAIAVSIWIVIFTILAVDKNPKYYLIALPLFILGFFTRYTVGFILPLMLLYFLSNHDIFRAIDNRDNLWSFFKSKEFIYISIASFISLILLLIFLNVILSYTHELMFLTQAQESTTGFYDHVKDMYFDEDYLYYVRNFLKFLFCEKIVFIDQKPVYEHASPISYLIFIIIASGLFLKLKSSKNVLITESFKTSNFKLILISLIMILAVIAVIGFKVSFLMVDIPLLIIGTIIYSLHKKDKNFKLSVFMIMWFLIYFIFFTMDSIKVERYILTVMPAFTYFFILSLNEITEKFKKNKLVKYFPVILIGVFLLLSFNFTETVGESIEKVDAKDVFDFLIEYDEDYKNKEIASVANRYACWYLQKDLKPLGKYDFNHLENVSYVVLNNETSLKKVNKVKEKRL